ncbi:MAG: LptF/LptG family permease [Deltaproteobacteria bacterium]|nr:LptF/LptG family permease [Deltaproteobacteria bacterium]
MIGTFGRRVAIEVGLAALLASFAFVVLLAVVDLVEIGNHLGTKEPSALEVTKLVLFGMPRLLRDVIAVGAPIGAATAIGAFVRRSEMGAYFAAGASPMRLFAPLLLVAILVALGQAALIEVVIPKTAAEVRTLRERLGIRRGIGVTREDDTSWFRSGERLAHVRARLDRSGTKLAGVSILSPKDGRLEARVDAQSAEWTGGEWVGKDVIARALTSEAITTTRARSRTIELAESPADLVKKVASPGLLTSSELLESVRTRERQGRPANEHQFERYARAALPLATVMSMLAAAGLALRASRKQTLALGLMIGASTGFSAWFVAEALRAMASARAVPPLVAALLVPLLVGLLAAKTWTHVTRFGLGEGRA